METAAPPAGPPVIASTLVIVPLVPSAVVAYHAADGTVAWRAELAAIRPLEADDERTYIVSREGVHALRAATGEPVWRADTGPLTAPLLVRTGWVIVATAEHVTALRAADGSLVWRRSLGTVEARPAIDGDRLFLPLLLETRITAVDLQSGETRWERELGGSPDEPLAVGGKVYTVARDKRFYALDADDGEIEWHRRVGAAPRGRPAADDDHIYYVALDNVLRALHRGHGAEKWTEGLPYRPSQGPTLVGGAILVPGPVPSVPVFGPGGTRLSAVTFPATLVGLSNVATGPATYPMVAAMTGDLQHAWTLSMFETSLDPPQVPLVPLTALPGQTIAIALPV